MSHVLGLDVSTTATKAILLDAEGVVRAVSSAEYPFETPRPLWSEQDPARWWDATVRAVRAVLARGGSARRCDRGGRARGPDARPRHARRRGAGAAPGDPVERPADRGGVRPDPRGARRGAAHRDHRQRRDAGVHRAEAPVGSAARAGHLVPDRPRPAPEGPRPAPDDGWVRRRPGRRRRDPAVRPGAARLVGRGARGARRRPFLAAEDVRRPGGHGRRASGSGRGARTPRGHAGGGRRRRPGRIRRRRRRRRTRPRLALARDLRRRLRHDGGTRDRAPGSPARVLPLASRDAGT